MTCVGFITHHVYIFHTYAFLVCISVFHFLMNMFFISTDVINEITYYYTAQLKCIYDGHDLPRLSAA